MSDPQHPGAGSDAEPPRNFPPTPLTHTDAAAATVGIDTAQVEAVAAQNARKGRIFAWGLWDWGSAAFNAVITTFVFTVYLTSESFGPAGTVEAQLGWALAIAGLLIALLAPITGQRSDASGRRKFWLAVNTYIVVALSACTLNEPSDAIGAVAPIPGIAPSVFASSSHTV